MLQAAYLTTFQLGGERTDHWIFLQDCSVETGLIRTGPVGGWGRGEEDHRRVTYAWMCSMLALVVRTKW